MAEPESQDPTPSANDVERAYLEYLERLERGDAEDFDAFCAARPAMAPELERLHRAWSDLSQCLGGSLASLLSPRELIGPPGPGTSRRTDQPIDTGDEPSFLELLARLKESTPSRSRYQLKGEIARGGMGVILHAYDHTLRRNLAMKVIIGRGQDEPTGRTPAFDSRSLGRFLDEAQVTGQLDHPGIVPVHELGVDDGGRVYFTMKLVNGVHFGAILDRLHGPAAGEWNLARAAATLLKVCDAMAFAHDKGIVHRDLKPSNIMVGAYGETYVMDWGLARFLDRDDRRDIRPRPPSDAGDSSSLVTMDGDVLGTPAYMPPEQALGQVQRIGKAADVYAVGAILYHLLAGRMPYLAAGEKVTPQAMLERVRQGPPRPLAEAAPRAPAELAAISGKAMARAVEGRYPSMQELGQDLRAYLESRVVQAYESGPLAELRKWAKRNKGIVAIAAAAFLLVVALTAWYIRDVRAKQRLLLQRQVELTLLAGGGFIDEARARAGTLIPAEPGMIDALDSWLASDLPRVIELKGPLMATLEDLESRALPWSTEERELDQSTHPLRSELETLERRVRSLELAEEVRKGLRRPAELPLPSSLAGLGVDELGGYAMTRVDHDDAFRIWGNEEVGLAVARHLCAAMTDDFDDLLKVNIVDLLAWACFANGLDREALEAAREARDRAVRYGKWDDPSVHFTSVERAVEEAPSTLFRLKTRLNTVRQEVAARRTYRFPDDDDRIRHATLKQLVRRISDFESSVAVAVERRLSWARSIEELTLSHPNMRVSWQQARDALRAADGVLASPLYAGSVIDLKPQLGLVPIGMNPVTKLWEFYDLRSATDVAAGQDPRHVPIPEHRPDGSITVEDGTGIVFALVPGGTFWMGAQNDDPTASGYVSNAEETEAPRHQVVLEPYFIARHELTTGQWYRLSDGQSPSWFRRGKRYDDDPRVQGWSHPVTNVSWTECDALLTRHGLTLPTEAQWERAARAGTGSTWWTGDTPESLANACNILDIRHAGAYPERAPQVGNLDDRFVSISPVGSFAANPFGLHDDIGNVWEWCLDAFREYTNPTRVRDGLRLGNARNEGSKIYRGGCFREPAFGSRPASRVRDAQSFRNHTLGVRAARLLR